MSGGSERRPGEGQSAHRRAVSFELDAAELTPTARNPSVLVAAADAEAVAARAALLPARESTCDACGERIVGEAGGSGLLLWWRGDELRYEEPPLCEGCAVAIGMSAQLAIDDEDDEEG